MRRYHNRLIRRILAGLLGLSWLAISPPLLAQSATYRTHHPELEYLKVINHAGPPRDPRLIFLLMQQFMNARQHQEGMAVFTTLIDQFESQIAPWQKALYVSALGLLRASYAPQVPLLKRVRWVRETIALLEQARQLSGNSIFMVRWITGTVFARLPSRFAMRDTARQDLLWCLDNRDKAPDRGWLREVYYYLARLAHQDQNDAQAHTNLRQSGYENFEKSITLTTAFAVNAEKGFTFGARQLREVVPGRVFALSGFDFAELYFIVSEDRSALIAVDAGTRPDSVQAAYEHLQRAVPDLPHLTTVFVTHAHWDHIGGHGYYRRLNPQVTFYANARSQAQLASMANRSIGFSYFFGSEFTPSLLTEYTPDVTVDRRISVTVGGTRFELIPITGGETRDGLFIHVPRHGVLFVGDFIMPYLGAPFVEAGNISGLFDAIGIVTEVNPTHLLHGHYPLTQLFHAPAVLAQLKTALEWLSQETMQAIHNGADRATIQQRNLIPPFLLQHPEIHLPYLVLRENVINRLYDQQVGYWQPNLLGMDVLGAADFGVLLAHYLGRSETQLAKAIGDMSSHGDHELAARTVTWALTQYPDSQALHSTHKQVFLNLKEKYQAINPFKFIVYSERIGHETPRME